MRPRAGAAAARLLPDELHGRGVRLLALLMAVRAAIPLAALAAHGHELPGLPRYTYDARPGDAFGYYSAVRALLATWRQGTVLLVAAVLLAVTAVLAFRLRRAGRGTVAVLAVAYGLGLVCALLARRMPASGAPTIGWPLVWSVPLLPYRALGLPLGPNLAFGVGLAISLAANAVTVVATAVVGVLATARARIGLAAAALYAFWPLLVGLVGGHRAWQNGTWQVDAGLHLYSEPVSTALVLVAVALCLRARPGTTGLALAGVLLSAASVVRLSNAVIAAAVLGVLAVRLGARRALPLAAGLGAFALVELAFWSKGYTHLARGAGGLPPHAFGLRYLRVSWTESLLWRPYVVALLLLPAIAGTQAVRGAWRRWLLWLPVAATAAFYSTYVFTKLHPRFLYVVLPPVLVLWCAGVATLAALARSRFAVAKGS